MELCTVLCGSLDGRGVWGRMDTCIYMTGSLLYSPETITTLLIGYTATQMEKAMAPHSSTLAWKIPWMEECRGTAPADPGYSKGRRRRRLFKYSSKI